MHDNHFFLSMSFNMLFLNDFNIMAHPWLMGVAFIWLLVAAYLLIRYQRKVAKRAKVIRQNKIKIWQSVIRESEKKK